MAGKKKGTTKAKKSINITADKEKSLEKSLENNE